VTVVAARRVGWLVVAVAVVLVGPAGLAAMAVSFRRMDMDGPETWAGVLSLVLAYLAAWVTLLAWVGRRLAMHTSAPGNDVLVARLRRAVRLQRAADVGIRQLRQPQPLRVRVRPTSRAVVPGWPGPGGSRADVAGLQGEDTAHPARTLVEAFRDDPCRQLVILGEAGARKPKPGS